MFTHNLDPVLLNFGFMAVRWYSLAYIAGIIIGWWLGKKIIIKKFQNISQKFDLREFDDLITYLIISIIIGGRIGYIIFYNLKYYISNPLDIVKSSLKLFSAKSLTPVVTRILYEVEFERLDDGVTVKVLSELDADGDEDT